MSQSTDTRSSAARVGTPSELSPPAKRFTRGAAPKGSLGEALQPHLHYRVVEVQLRW